jgi:hypothetical protein
MERCAVTASVGDALTACSANVSREGLFFSSGAVTSIGPWISLNGSTVCVVAASAGELALASVCRGFVTDVSGVPEFWCVEVSGLSRGLLAKLLVGASLKSELLEELPDPLRDTSAAEFLDEVFAGAEPSACCCVFSASEFLPSPFFEYAASSPGLAVGAPP